LEKVPLLHLSALSVFLFVAERGLVIVFVEEINLGPLFFEERDLGLFVERGLQVFFEFSFQEYDY